MNARTWLQRYAEKLGTEPPTAEEFRVLLDLAGVAAHASERVAAPVACWLTAKAGTDVQTAMRLAQEVGSEDG